MDACVRGFDDARRYDTPALPLSWQALPREPTTFRALLIATTYCREYLIHRDPLHAKIVGAGRNALIECVDAWAAWYSRPEDVTAWRFGSEYGGCFRAEQCDDIYWRHDRIVSRPAIVRDQNFRKAIYDE